MIKFKLIINTSTLSGTGVVQVAVSFINECKKIEGIEYFVFLSNKVCSNINRNDFPSNFHFYNIPAHPIYGLRGFKVRRMLHQLENQIKPDCVFSVFGPSCWKPKAPHLMGYAYPHYVYPESPVFQLMSFRQKMNRLILKYIHKYFLLRDGAYYVCETTDVSNRLVNYLSISPKQIYTVSNTYNHFFEKQLSNNDCNYFMKERGENEFRFLSLCSPMFHKNLQILNQVIPLLKDFSVNVKFVVTMSDKAYRNLFIEPNRTNIINIGPLTPEECPRAYEECDAVFISTLLECFSATYPEAMKMKKPIITSNLPFAHCICGNAALFCNSLDPHEIVDAIDKLISDKHLYKILVQKGTERLEHFLTAEERANRYINICKKISNSKC